MRSFVDRLLRHQAGYESVPSDARLDRFIYLLNACSFVWALALGVIFLAVGLTQAAAITAVAALSWACARFLMNRGRRDAGRRLQHATGLTMLTLIAVVLGPEVRGRYLLLVAAAMSPIIWTRKERLEWWLHLGVAFVLWAVLESGALAASAVVPASSDLAAGLALVFGLGIFGVLSLIPNIQNRVNEITESRLGEANENLKLQISEREGIEVELGFARDEAQSANRAKDDFLASMSYEIRTPMSTIIGVARLCTRNELAPRVREYMNRIRSSSHTLQGIINDILDLSRIEAREIELDESSFDLRDVMDQLADLVGDRASAKGIEFLVAVDPDVPRRLFGDPLRLGQVLTNLANNAVKFTAQGSVVVRVQRLSNDSEQERLRFEVQDTGIGIPKDLVEGLFESFVQADGSTTRRFGGSGLGLTISKSLVELMGGVIQVESEVGQGSCFSFDLTLACVGGDTGETLLAPPELEGLRVLVVHDNPVASEVICSLLSSLAFVPKAVRTEAECLQALSSAQDGSRPFDLVLVDWSMTGRDAVGFWRRIGVEPRLAQIPTVVMVSSKHREAVAGPAGEVRIAGVLVKPVRASALLEVVREVFDQESPGLQQWLESSGFIPAVHRIQGSRILVAEDKEVDQLVVREIFEHAGLDVTIVSSGEAAVREAAKGCFEMVLMDVHMPGLDGPAATVAMRADPKTSYLPIIAMTADATTETRARCFESGMNDFVAKPISVSELLTKVVHWIGPDPDSPTAPPSSAKDASAASEQRSSQDVFDELQEAKDVSDIPDIADIPPRLLTDPMAWFGRLIAFGVPTLGSPELIKRRRLANGLVLILFLITAVYGPIYLAMGFVEVAAIAAGMAIFWLLSYGMMLGGWHRSGRVLAVLVGLVGCTGYALAFGPQANYHALLFIGVVLSPLVFTLREQRWNAICSLAAAGLWWLVESRILESLAIVEASDTVFALLRGNAGMICFGFIGFSANLMARESYQAEKRLQEANGYLREEIGERAKAERALVAAREVAEDARLAKSEFLANMSHEIRTPMNAILGLTELCLRLELADDVRDQITRIRSSAQALLRIINDILDLSRLEAHRFELECLDFDLDLVFERLQGSVGPSASGKGLELLLESGPDVPFSLRGDALRLEQVLSNLVVNAVNATEQGKVVVRVERRTSESSSALLRFSVTDTGVGFPFRSIAVFADAIGRDIRYAADRRRGRGLGLTISQSLVELMGGELLVESTPNAGSTFWFDLHLEPGAGDAARDKTLAAQRSTWQSLRGLSVLVAEDNEANQLVARGILEDAGLQVKLVGDGREALEAMAVSSFDVVLMDLHMPVMDGYEATRRIRQNASHADVPVLAMTADSRSETREACREAGMNGHVAKPVDPAELLANLMAWLAPGESNEADREDEWPPEDEPAFAVEEVVLPAELPGIDLRKALDRMSGRQSSLVEVLRSVDRRFRGREAEIEEAWRRGDVGRALEIVHLIKGLAGNISAHELYSCSSSLEEAMHEGHEASVPGLVEEHRLALDQVMGSVAILENSLVEQAAAMQTADSGRHVDTLTLETRLNELIGLLGARNLRARSLFHELTDLVDASGLASDFQELARDVHALDFASAERKLRDYVQQWGMKVDEQGGQDV